jgi:hypothetical protein
VPFVRIWILFKTVSIGSAVDSLQCGSGTSCVADSSVLGTTNATFSGVQLFSDSLHLVDHNRSIDSSECFEHFCQDLSCPLVQLALEEESHSSHSRIVLSH